MKHSKRNLLAVARRGDAGGRRRAGADLGQRDQDRRADRHVEPLHRPRGRGLGRRGARWRSRTSGIEKRGIKVEIVSADHQNKPDVGSAHRAPVVRRRQGRRDRRRAELRRRARGQPDHQGQEQGVPRLGPGTSDLTGKACSPNTVHWAYDTWMLANGTGTAITKAGGDTWFFITADYAFGQALERDTTAAVTKNGGKVLGGVQGAAQQPGLLARSCCRRRRRRPRSSASPTPAATPPTRSSRRPSSASSRAARSLAGLLVFITDVHALGLQTAQGLIVHRDVLLGHERPDARVRQALRRAGQGHPSDDGARRRVRVGAALPEGGRGAEERRRHQGRRQDEGDADRRSAVRQGHDPRRRPQDPPGVPGRGEEAGGVEGRRGTTTRSSRRSRRTRRSGR